MSFGKSLGQKFENTIEALPVLGKVVKEWKMLGTRIRRDTFTKWCNFILQDQQVEIHDLASELSDGTNLTRLYQILAREEMSVIIWEPKSDKDKKNNLNALLRAMDYHAIPCDKIDLNGIMQGDINTIFSVLWGLFLRFELGIRLGGQNLTTDLNTLVIIWLNSVLSDHYQVNFTSTWTDGLALCKLVNTLKPGSLPDYEYYLPENAKENLATAMKVANESFGVPNLLNASDIADKHTDDQCMVMYFAYFMKEGSIGEKWTVRMLNELQNEVKIVSLTKNLNNGLLLHKLVKKLIPIEMRRYDAKTNLGRVQFSMDVAKKCLGVNDIVRPEDFHNCSITRIEIIAYLSQFNISKTTKKGINPFYRSESLNDSGTHIPVDNEMNGEFNSSDESQNDSVLEVSGPYKDPEPGTYVIKLFEDIKLNTNFPSLDNINKDALAISVSGQGLSEGIIGDTLQISINKNGSSGKVEMSVENPNGVIKGANVIEGKEGVVKACYIPTMKGLHNIYIFVDGLEIPNCPYKCVVDDRKKVSLKLPESASDGNNYCRVNEVYEIMVSSEGTHLTDLECYVKGDNMNERKIDVVQKDTGDYIFPINLTEVGEYQIIIYHKKSIIPHFPLHLVVNDPHFCVAHGEGLFKARVGQGAEFKVDSRDAGSGIFNMTIDNADVVADVKEIGINQYVVHYTPKQVGILNIHLSYGGVALRGSPFQVRVTDPSLFVSKLKQTSVKAGDTVFLEVAHDHNAVKGDITYEISGPNGFVEGHIDQDSDNRITLTFKPQSAGVYKVTIYMDGFLVMGSPTFISVKEVKRESYPELVTITGNIKQAITEEANRIEVDVLEAGEGELTVETQTTGKEVVYGFKKIYEGLYLISYYPQEDGFFQFIIKWDGKHIKGSPFSIMSRKVEPAKETILKVTKVLPEEALVKHERVEEVLVQESHLQPVEAYVKDYPDGPVEDVLVKESQLQTVEAQDNVDGGERKIRLSGLGLKKAFLNQRNTMKLETNKPLEHFRATAVGEKTAYTVIIEKFNEFLYEIRYKPTEEGSVTLSLEIEGQVLVGFPLKLQATYPVDAKKIVLLDDIPPDRKLKYPVILSLNTQKAGESKLTFLCTFPSGLKEEGEFHQYDGTKYEADFSLREVGNHRLDVLWAGEPIPKSPFSFDIGELPDPNQVIVYGSGLKDGKLDEYVGSFFVQTKGAGPGTLTVKINGPQGAFDVNMEPADTKERLVRVSYNPLQEGLYIIHVYWAGRSVPGSPHNVKITSAAKDTEIKMIRRVVTYHERPTYEENKAKKKKHFSLKINRRRNKSGRAKVFEIDENGEVKEKPAVEPTSQ